MGGEPDLSRAWCQGHYGTKAEADAAVATIRNRGRLIVGLDIGSNLFSFRDPITGEITGFDVDIAGEIARDIFGTRVDFEDKSYDALQGADALALVTEWHEFREPDWSRIKKLMAA